MSGEDVTGNPLDYESAVAIIVKELRPFTWNARFLAKRVLEGLGVPALLAECEARQKENEELRGELATFIETGGVWSCSSRCWQEGGPHDETCRCTPTYTRRELGGESV